MKAEFRTKHKSQTSLWKTKSYTKPRVYVLICISKQITDKCWTKFRYNLQFIKCTVCIVQDKVVKVVRLSGPVPLWDFELGSLFQNGLLHSHCKHKKQAVLYSDCPYITCETENTNMKLSRWISQSKMKPFKRVACVWVQAEPLEGSTLLLWQKPHLISLHQDITVWQYQKFGQSNRVWKLVNGLQSLKPVIVH